jgi:hypothetical protein
LYFRLLVREKATVLYRLVAEIHVPSWSFNYLKLYCVVRHNSHLCMPTQLGVYILQLQLHGTWINLQSTARYTEAMRGVHWIGRYYTQCGSTLLFHHYMDCVHDKQPEIHFIYTAYMYIYIYYM